ncbi:hypothetical protein Hanom_Chr16g01491811 [Helianthus anomalus]
MREMFMVEKEKIVAKDGEEEKIECNMEMVVKEKVEVDKGKGPVKADLPIFVPQWKVRTSDTTKSSDVCHDMLKNMATPAEKKALSNLSDEDVAYRIITQAARLFTSLPDSIKRWAASAKIDDEMRKVEVYAGQLSDFNNLLAKEWAAFGIERAKYRQERVADEAVTEELRQEVKQLKEDKKWLIGSCICRFVTYLLHSKEFNLHLAGIYFKAMAHGHHTGLIV